MKDRLLRGIVRVVLRDPFVRVLSRRRQSGRDEGLDRQIAAILEVERLGRYPRLESMEVPAARKYSERGFEPLELPRVPMREIVDTTIGAIPVRLYVPPEASSSWVMYLHGGGGVIGSVPEAEPLTRWIAARTRCTVASVSYRLGPEHKHPAAIEDACAAFAGLAARVPAGGKIAVAGDSFGGYLTAQIDHHALVTRARQPDLAVMIYPMVDQTMSSPSIERLAEGYLLTKPMMTWFRNGYTRPTDDRRAMSPLFWSELRGSAPTVVATAGFDPLTDEGEAYAERLRAAGVDVRHLAFPSLIHGFVSIAGAVGAARDAVDMICDEIRHTFGT